MCAGNTTSPPRPAGSPPSSTRSPAPRPGPLVPAGERVHEAAGNRSVSRFAQALAIGGSTRVRNRPNLAFFSPKEAICRGREDHILLDDAIDAQRPDEPGELAGTLRGTRSLGRGREGGDAVVA